MGPNNKSSSGKKKIEGSYANYFKVGHNAFEFVIDFGQYYTGNEEAELCQRIVTGPVYAKKLLKILEQSVQQYESSFGMIKE